MIIAVSDLHFGNILSNREGFINFIDEFLKPKREEISHLVLLGDILDFWKRDTVTVIQDFRGILQTLDSLGFEVKYVVGNHDFIMTEQNNRKFIRKKLPNTTFCKEFQVDSGDTSFRFIHGHQINYWHSLPFYETFSRAMCDTEGQYSERTDVWSIIDEYSDVPPKLHQAITNLMDATKDKIESKFAGPLEGPAHFMGEVQLEETNLLRSIIQLNQFPDLIKQKKSHIGLRETLRTLSLENNRAMYLDSMISLKNAAQNMDYENLAVKFLVAWKDSLEFISTSSSRNPIRDRHQLLQYLERMAAMFTTELQFDEFLIHGHGHRFFVNQDTRTADTGCWIKNKASFVKIVDGIVSCTPWSKR